MDEVEYIIGEEDKVKWGEGGMDEVEYVKWGERGMDEKE